MNGREKCKAALTRRLQQERQSQLQLNRNRKNGRISNYELDNINRDNKSIKSEILSLESALAKVDRGIALAPDQKALLEEDMLAQADKFIQGRFLGAKERARLTAMKELEDKKAQADRLGALNSSDPMLQQQLSQLLGGASNCDYVLQKLNDGIPLSEEEMVVLDQANHNHLMMSSQLAVEATRQVEALSALRQRGARKCPKKTLTPLSQRSLLRLQPQPHFLSSIQHPNTLTINIIDIITGGSTCTTVNTPALNLSHHYYNTR